MTEKRMLIVDDELLRKIDENRGEMSRIEFLNFIISSQLQEEVISSNNNSHTGIQAADVPSASHQYVEREEFQEFAAGMKDLLRRFLDFFISYGLELGQEPKDNTFAELVQKLQTLSASGVKQKNTK
jgi:hypothetical protein